jgi:hypothetical protein
MFRVAYVEKDRRSISSEDIELIPRMYRMYWADCGYASVRGFVRRKCYLMHVHGLLKFEDGSRGSLDPDRGMYWDESIVSHLAREEATQMNYLHFSSTHPSEFVELCKRFLEHVESVDRPEGFEEDPNIVQWRAINFYWFNIDFGHDERPVGDARMYVYLIMVSWYLYGCHSENLCLGMQSFDSVYLYEHWGADVVVRELASRQLLQMPPLMQAYFVYLHGFDLTFVAEIDVRATHEPHPCMLREGLFSLSFPLDYWCYGFVVVAVTPPAASSSWEYARLDPSEEEQKRRLLRATLDKKDLDLHRFLTPDIRLHLDTWIDELSVLYRPRRKKDTTTASACNNTSRNAMYKYQHSLFTNEVLKELRIKDVTTPAHALHCFLHVLQIDPFAWPNGRTIPRV